VLCTNTLVLNGINVNQPTSKNTILVAGHLCLDIIPDLSLGGSLDDLKPGSLSMIGPVETATGGVVANTGLALYRLGQSVRLVAKVGDDEFGKLIYNKFEAVESGLGDSLILDSASHTSYTVVLDFPEQDRHFLHHPGANDTLLNRDIPDSAFTDADLIHFGYPPLLASMVANDGKELISLFRRVKSAGMVSSLDMAWVDPSSNAGQVDWPAVLKNILPHIDIFMPSIEEISFMLGETMPSTTLDVEYLRRISQRLLDYGAGIVVLKLGEFGLYLRSSSEMSQLESLERLGQSPQDWTDLEIIQPCFKVEEKGSTGAGDSAIAGFLAALCRGSEPEFCLQMAAAVGACKVEAHDALSGLRTWDDTQQRIDAGWPLSENRVIREEITQ